MLIALIHSGQPGAEQRRPLKAVAGPHTAFRVIRRRHLRI